MDADLTCPECGGTQRRHGDFSWHPCNVCTDGRRRPTLNEYDALRAERDRLRAPISLVRLFTTCDWGDCYEQSDWLRWDDTHGWLPVCDDHEDA